MPEADTTKSKRLEGFPLSRLFPNLVTLLGLCAGFTSVRFALYNQWEMAITFIVIAAFIDGLDGRLARLLNSTSSFGAQLDSLSDIVNFGVSPALVMYLWATHDAPIKGLGWAVTLFFIICQAVRLARFNSQLEDEERKPWQDKFFTGIPAPSGAGLSLVPAMLTFQFGSGFYSEPLFMVIYMAVLGFLMTSRIPTFSGKKIRVRHEFVSILFVFAAVVIIAMILEPWITLPLMGLIYIASIPVSVAAYHYIKYKEQQAKA